MTIGTDEGDDAQRFTALHRLGREECRGAFSSDLRPLAGEPNPVIFTLD